VAVTRNKPCRHPDHPKIHRLSYYSLLLAIGGLSINKTLGIAVTRRELEDGYFVIKLGT
jgi:hypothetical protein